MFGWYKLLRGLLRRNILLSYYRAIQSRSLIGMICRLWGWLHNTSVRDDEVFNRPKFKWAFDLSEEVQVRGSKRIGMIFYRWIRFGWKIYEIKIGSHYYAFYEDQLAKTNLRVYGKVVIQEIRFKTLREGHSYMPTKRWIYHPPYPITY